MKNIYLVSAALLVATNIDGAIAGTRCMTDKAQGVSRIVAIDEDSARELGWRGPSASGIRPLIVPVERDNGNRTPGAFRLAYFYRGHTTAFYTSHVHPEQASIQYVDDAPKACGVTE